MNNLSITKSPMKRVKKFAATLCIAGLAAFGYSCQQDKATEVAPTSSELSKTDLKALTDAGLHAKSGVYGTFKGLPGDAPVEGIFVGDIFVSRKQLDGGNLSLQSKGGINKQYHTYSLVSAANRNIRVVGYTGSGFALTSNMRTGLQWAVNNYNRLGGSSIRMELVFQDTFNDTDVVVYNNGEPGGGAVAGFPENGRAYDRVEVNAGMDRYNTNVIEHVITHELGHCIGFRHQDWATRFSCNGSREQEEPYGAVLINGTPSSDRAASVMRACFGGDEDGEFTSTDVTAIETLY